MTFTRITCDPKKMYGQPCIRNLRLTVRRVVEAVAAGAQHFGENRVEEATDKIPVANRQSPVPLTWRRSSMKSL